MKFPWLCLICCHKCAKLSSILTKHKQPCNQTIHIFDCFSMVFTYICFTLVLPPAVAFYPLTKVYRAVDVSKSRNPPGILGNVKPAPGPNGKPGGSYRFWGNKNSYIHFPNRGRLDTRNSITLLAWVNPEGLSGPIFNYNPRGWGVHFWIIRSNTLFVRFVTRRRKMTKPLISAKVRPKAWNFVAASYDQRTGVAKLYIDAVLVAKTRIGKIRLSTNYPSRMGARIGDKRNFRGRITCMQVYDVALYPSQIREARKRCFKGASLL